MVAFSQRNGTERACMIDKDVIDLWSILFHGSSWTHQYNKTLKRLKCFKYLVYLLMYDRRRPFLSQLWLVRSLLHCLVEGLFFMRVHDPIGRRSRILQ
jgi:hypothetical protein